MQRCYCNFGFGFASTSSVEQRFITAIKKQFLGEPSGTVGFLFPDGTYLSAPEGSVHAMMIERAFDSLSKPDQQVLLQIAYEAGAEDRVPVHPKLPIIRPYFAAMQLIGVFRIRFDCYHELTVQMTTRPTSAQWEAIYDMWESTRRRGRSIIQFSIDVPGQLIAVKRKGGKESFHQTELYMFADKATWKEIENWVTSAMDSLGK